MPTQNSTLRAYFFQQGLNCTIIAAFINIYIWNYTILHKWISRLCPFGDWLVMSAVRHQQHSCTCPGAAALCRHFVLNGPSVPSHSWSHFENSRILWKLSSQETKKMALFFSFNLGMFLDSLYWPLSHVERQEEFAIFLWDMSFGFSAQL